MPKATLDVTTLDRSVPTTPTEYPANLLRGLCTSHRLIRQAWWGQAISDHPDEATLDSLFNALDGLVNQIVAIKSADMLDLRAKAGLLTDMYGDEAVILATDPFTTQAQDARVVYSILADLGVRV